jgi:hypothetical protein
MIVERLSREPDHEVIRAVINYSKSTRKCITIPRKTSSLERAIRRRL